MMKWKLTSVLVFLLSASFIPDGGLFAAPQHPDITSWDEMTKQRQRDAGNRVIADLNAAARRGEKEFVIKRGHYRFNKLSPVPGGRKGYVCITNINDMVIDGSGSTFWFEDAYQGISIADSSNLTIRNLFLDWDPLPFTQGTVVDVDEKGKTIDVAIDPAYREVAPRFTELRDHVNEQPYVVSALFDTATRRFKAGTVGYRVLPFWGNGTDGRYRARVLTYYNAEMRDVGFAKGDLITFAIRPEEGAILSSGTANVLLEDITLYASPSLCYVEGPGTGATTYRRCHILRRPGTDRLLAGTADGFHSTHFEHGPVIDSCRVEAIGDDGVNVHGCFYKVFAQENPTTLVLEQIGWRCDLAETITLHLYQVKDMQYLGMRKATSAFTTWKDNGTGKAFPAHRVTLTAPISIGDETVVTCEEYTGAGAVIKNSTFSNILTRGILIQTSNARIENNNFDWIGNAAILSEVDPYFWKVSTHVHHAFIVGNRIVDSNVRRTVTQTADSAAINLVVPGNLALTRWQHDIMIASNDILRPGGAGIAIRGGERITVVDNRIRAHNTRDPKPFLFDGGNYQYRPLKDEDLRFGIGHALICESVRDLVLRKNVVEEPGKYAKGPIAETNVTKRSGVAEE